MVGRKIVLTAGGVSSQRNTAQATPKGTPTISAPRVTQKEPTIIGKIPKDPRLGNQRSPRRKEPGPTFQMRGTPCSKMKKAIKASMPMEEKAMRRKLFSKIFSFDIFRSRCLSLGNGYRRHTDQSFLNKQLLSCRA